MRWVAEVKGSYRDFDLTPYSGRWVAVSRRTQVIAGVGDSADKAIQLAQHNRPKEHFSTFYIDPDFLIEPLLIQIALLLADEDQPVYLVGGAVRDALLGRLCHDLDFIVANEAIPLAFRVADALDVPAYVLDRERDVGRVILDGAGTMLDFTRLRGDAIDGDLLSADLSDRDFTINAMAVALHALHRADVIDPFDGRADLQARLIRVVQPDAISRDAVRALRGVRQALQFGFTIEPQTRAAIKIGVRHLDVVSAERIRDELVKTITGPQPDQAVELWQELALLPAILPEIAALDGVAQSAPHHEPVLAHTVSVLHWLTRVEAILRDGVQPDDQVSADIDREIGPWRTQIFDHLLRPIDGELTGHTILRLSALFHDVGKSITQEIDDDGRIRFFGHDTQGATLAGKRLQALKLSNEVIDGVRRIVAQHMRPLLLAQEPTVSSRALFRLCRITDSAIVDVALLALADHLATYAGPHGDWSAFVTLIGRIIAFYYTHVVAEDRPSPLLNGHMLIVELGMEPGPEIGRILRLVEEAQVVGDLTTVEEALRYARDVSMGS